MSEVYNGGIVIKSDWNGILLLLAGGPFCVFTGYKLGTLIDYENGVN